MFISLKILPPSYQHCSLVAEASRTWTIRWMNPIWNTAASESTLYSFRQQQRLSHYRICSKHQVEPLSWRRWLPIYAVFKVLYKMYKSEQHPSNQSPSELLYHPEHKVHTPRSSSFRVRRLQVPSQFSQVKDTRLLFYCCNNYFNQGKW